MNFMGSGHYVHQQDREKIQTSSYFTMLSIIQGVSFGVLFYRIDKLVDWDDLSFIENDICALNFWIILVLTFFSICMTWNEYARVATRLNWKINFRDTFIPFLLGATELMCCNTIGIPKSWLFSFSLWTIMGCIAYLNIAYTFKDYSGSDVKLIDNAIRNYISCCICVFFVFITVLIGLFLLKSIGNAVIARVGVIVSIIMVIMLFLSWKYERSIDRL